MKDVYVLRLKLELRDSECLMNKAQQTRSSETELPLGHCHLYSILFQFIIRTAIQHYNF